ncbi:isochorismatase domain-containing protein 2 isoform X1 [Ciconia boyciana]|uniref:isochorismatase domain-containing protein 2 isoform X1 n=1 Tax=Ciconia boyciana TaxID=52775 RepID=UPI003BA2956B
MAGRRLGRLAPGSSILFLCDMQERFRHSVAFFPQVVAVAARVLQVPVGPPCPRPTEPQGCRELGVPVVVTEQHPRVLGPTVPELGAHDLPKHPKTCFSMVVPAVEAELRARPHLAAALLCGIETQACILQTALDLLERGLDVHVVVDACSSRSQVDRLVALGRLQQSGAFLTTSESLLLLLLRDAAHPCFRQVLPLIKEPAPDSGLLPLLGGLGPPGGL